MVPAKKFSVEQIVAKLREMERLQGQGLTIPQGCKRLGISDQTFYRWRLKYGALKEDELDSQPPHAACSCAGHTVENTVCDPVRGGL